MDPSLLVIIVVATALAFDFTNGFHDTANAMATSIATGALRPRVAVALSAVLNLVGSFLSIEVAKTISGGVVDDAQITPAVIFGGLIGTSSGVAGGLAATDPKLVPYGCLTAAFYNALGCLLGPSLLFFVMRGLLG